MVSGSAGPSHIERPGRACASLWVMSFHKVTDPDRLHALIDAMLLIESDLDLSTLLQSIVGAACELVGTRYGALGISNAEDTELTNFITVGLTEDQRRRIGDMPRGHGLLGEVMVKGVPRRSDDLLHDPDAHGFPSGHPVMKTFLGVPVMSRDGTMFGNLYLTDRLDAEAFTDDDEALLESFGHAAGLIVDQARLRDQLRELTLTEERERLARDLHDTVIQRLFAVGLSLQATLSANLEDPVRERISSAVDDLDETIREIRTTIFEIARDRTTASAGLRSRVLSIIDEVTNRLSLPVDVSFNGPVDARVGPVLAAHVLNVLRELLTNAVRHSGADRVEVTIEVSDENLVLTVRDDGVGFSGDATVGRGIRNITERAAEVAGRCEIFRVDPRGTNVVWTACRLD